jgi:hypothetical protein
VENCHRKTFLSKNCSAVGISKKWVIEINGEIERSFLSKFFEIVVVKLLLEIILVRKYILAIRMSKNES